MAYAHIGHDAILEDDVVVSNGAQIGGHVVIGRGAVLGARSALHQYVRVGRGAMVAAGSFVVSDVPPWSLVAGDRGRLLGPNRVALASADKSALVRKALRMLRGTKTTGTQVLEALGRDHQEVRDIADFIDAPSQRGICRWGSAS
jgi:UDP-N-acetylglucosamine acyltransferase